jgi:CopG antitoxin of type II toxin-antitoxin system
LSLAAKTVLNAEEFDRRFDDCEDMSDYLDWSRARRPGLESKRVNLDMPQHMVAKLDVHARNRGVTRQALIKMWLADRLEVGV